jgi:hypothetical protein
MYIATDSQGKMYFAFEFKFTSDLHRLEGRRRCASALVIGPELHHHRFSMRLSA